VPIFVIRAAVQEADAKRYTAVFTTGGPVAGSGTYRNEYHTAAHVAYTRLLAEGLATNLLHKVPSKIRDHDRTYGAALALRQWFDDPANHFPPPKSLNVLTESVHARRSRLLFQKAFGPGTKVGIISVPSIDYEPSRWWRYSGGVKEVISESVAYIYARLFFWP
jgi:hypothetical protein